EPPEVRPIPDSPNLQTRALELSGRKIKHSEEANKQIQDLTAKVNKISEKCERIAKFIEESEAYSYQYNIKIVGVPAVAERETAQQTADLRIKLFTALGVEDVSISDIDTAHRVPSRLASSRPKAIICKFVRRLAKDKVMAARRAVGKLNAEQLHFKNIIGITETKITNSNESNFHPTIPVISLIRLSKKTYYQEYFTHNITNMKKTWEGINEILYRRRKTSKTISSLKDLNNNVEILNTSIKSVHKESLRRLYTKEWLVKIYQIMS
ncbi:Hypothetical predicted protein, partial [Paramuricea clavata]